MKKIITLSALLLAVAFTFSSCSKEKQLKKRLVGTWNIDKFDGTITDAGGGAATPYSFANAGTFTFKDDNTGSYSIVILGTTDNGSINWANTENSVTITESGAPTIIYTVTTNEETRQVWTTTYIDDGDQISEVITFSKK
ncbi:MAG: hypothetical protein EXR21_10045 [Flavobacteriaceae bacterium]|nr:hypothetical protein [Flavobacteriaceae bacterium]